MILQFALYTLKKNEGISEIGRNAISNFSQPVIPSKVNPSNISSSISTPQISATKIPLFVGSDIRAFDSIEEAYHAFNLYVYDKDLKLEYNSDKGFDYKVVFQAIILCKFLSTIKWKFDEFKKYYRIEYQIKRFWKQSTWRATYNNLTYQFIIQTGYTFGGYTQCGNYQNPRYVHISWILYNRLCEKSPIFSTYSASSGYIKFVGASK